MKKSARLLSVFMSFLTLTILLPLPNVRAAEAPGQVQLTEAPPDADNTRNLAWQARMAMRSLWQRRRMQRKREFELLAEVEGSALQYAHDGASRDEARYYWVRAYAQESEERAYGACSSRLWESKAMLTVE